MKKMLLTFCGIMLTLLSFNAQAQESPKDYFVGKWDILVEGTPKGDAHSILILKRVDGKLTGEMNTEGNVPTKLTRVEESDEEVTVYFTTDSGYDVYLYVEKIDANTVEGSMMDMFDASGKRMKE